MSIGSIRQEGADENAPYVDEMRGGKNNVLVAVRVRPLSKQETQNGHFNIVSCVDDRIVILYDPQEVMNQGGQLYEFQANQIGTRGKEKQYAFDYVFDKHVSQETVFDKSVKFALDKVLEGFNATVFAYGATGAGKTYTMLGTEDDYGVMGLTFLELFKKIDDQKKNKEFKILMSYLEIYNENIRDLLISNAEKTLDLREDAQKGIIVNGLTEVIATSVDEVMTLLRIGNQKRTTEATNANETSSRSHAILQVIIEYKDKFSGAETELNFAKLSLIDLAGSERGSSTMNKGARMLEGAAINKSLLALGNCITALAHQKPGEKPYIPYRDSKLTRLLKDSLGGNCRTVMITNISPSSGTFEDTNNTLLYANRAKKIKNKLERNVLNMNYHIGKYSQIISQLKQELADSKLQLQQKSLESNASLGFFGSMKNIPGFEQFKGELRQHFEDETKVKLQIIECEKKIDEIGFTMLKLKNEANQKTRDLGKGHLATKKALEEIEVNYEKIQENTNQKEYLGERLSELTKKRDFFPQIWKTSNELHGGELPQAYLNLMLKYEILNQDRLESRRRDERQADQNKLNELQLKFLQEQIFLRDNIIEKSRTLLTSNQIKFTLEDNYNTDSVYDMLENAETSFPLLKTSRSAKLLKRRPSQVTNSFQMPEQSQTPNISSQKSSFLPPISQTPTSKSISARMMEGKKNRMDSFSSRPSISKNVLEGNGVGHYKGQTGPNIVIQKINDKPQTNPQTPTNAQFQKQQQPTLRTVQSHSVLERQQENPLAQSLQVSSSNVDLQGGNSTLKRRPTIILRPKDNKPYLLVKTTRAKEEEKQKNQLGSVLYPSQNTKSQPILRYQRAFKSVVDMMPNADTSFRSAGGTDDSGNSLTRSEISMYNTDNPAIKHIYTTKSLITHRLANSPYVHSPSKRKLEKPWRVNMQNKNFVESMESKKFLNMLAADVEVNQNHIQSLKRKIGPSKLK